MGCHRSIERWTPVFRTEPTRAMSVILKLAIPVPLHRVFDYLAPPGIDPNSLQPGIRVEAPFGRGRKIGILLEVANHSNIEPDRLRQALLILDDTPLLSRTDLRLVTWASHYYHHPIGEAMASALTVLLRKGESAAPETQKRLMAIVEPFSETASPDPGRAPRQAQLLARLREASLHGLSYTELAGLEHDYTGAARSLVGKGLAVWREAPLPVAGDEPISVPAADGPALNAHQETAVAAVVAALGTYRAFLLEGVTGSGKTEVYLRLIQAILTRGQQAMILLPEINLTPQLEARFRARFTAPLVVFHSQLGDQDRRRAWLSMQRGDSAILLGTRSAVFTPAPALGLVILDEEHDSSFKQQDGFRFSARDVAVMRARQHGVPILLGSATPSLESLHNVDKGRYTRLELPYRAGKAAAPRFQVLDIRAQRLDEGLSAQLAGGIADTLARGEQSLLFVNRRGYAPTIICHDCGWIAPCRYCDAHLVIHAGDRRLRCHHCGFEQVLPLRCPDCGHEDLRPLGLGTERVEAVLKERFPHARIARIDRDSTRRKGSLTRVLEDIQAGRVHILIGTQMLAKGHHFPGVTLVGILDVDAGLYSLDFRAGERTAQLIIQVAGRAGREEKPGTVILQTRHPDHPLLLSLVRGGYPAFAQTCLEERKSAGLPPYAHQALWRAESLESPAAQHFLDSIAALARAPGQPTVQILGPVPAPLSRRGNRFRWQLLMQTRQRGALHTLLHRLAAAADALEQARKVRWSVDVDPVDLY